MASIDMSRRGFVSMVGAASAAGAVALSAFGSQATAFAATPENWDLECDILIAGSGSGASAAIIDAYDSGSDVLVVEVNDWMGGTLRRCGGGIGAAGSCVQKALGVEDDVEKWYDYLVACGEGLVDEDLLRTFVDRAASDFDWIVQDLAGQTEADWKFCEPAEGDEILDGGDGTNGMIIAMRPGLDVSGTPYWSEYGIEPTPRCYWFAANPDDVDPNNERQYCPAGLLGRPDTDASCGGTGLWKVFQDAIDERGVNTRLKTRFDRLIANAEGEVIGAICTDLDTNEQLTVKARKGIIIATGTWVGDDYLAQNYMTGQDIEAVRALFLPQMVTGEGVHAAQELGAATISMAAGSWTGGLRTDTNAQVLNVYGDPIPRLYASSYAVGGKNNNDKYPHCGLHNMWNMSLGRVAAANVCALEPWE